ncbi:unnamed protein product [Mycetohabitans rhizoxinica HKI 454]|uniref:Uncharacterized protein n=1 Tax=Mycetohabitans rhizoxinica (strain DSM 19002 / CIP 109453 / HKI 454) TaxID=882378 RepID=E5AL03_MYCRK|nr:unnamed protein product [Mycetohabitans rhizoxinica HKI 454]
MRFEEVYSDWQDKRLIGRTRALTQAEAAQLYTGWNVRQFHSGYQREHGGTRSYT